MTTIVSIVLFLGAWVGTMDLGRILFIAIGIVVVYALGTLALELFKRFRRPR